MPTKYSNGVKPPALSNTTKRNVKNLENVWSATKSGGPQTFLPFLSNLQAAQWPDAAGSLTLRYATFYYLRPLSPTCFLSLVN